MLELSLPKECKDKEKVELGLGLVERYRGHRVEEEGDDIPMETGANSRGNMCVGWSEGVCMSDNCNRARGCTLERLNALVRRPLDRRRWGIYGSGLVIFVYAAESTVRG
jgi:hypothetical protein